VTHQGSAHGVTDDVLSAESKDLGVPLHAEPVMDTQEPYCHFCQCPCAAFIRLDFLHRTASRLASTPWEWPPPVG
jgi:hypothetical protein